MKSESQVRYYIRIAESSLSEKAMGENEKAATLATINVLKWVVNKNHYTPDSTIMDAMLDDMTAGEGS